MTADKKAIAFMTSGGDAQGMNAAVRAIVRAAITLNVEIFAIKEGYQGLVEGWLEKMSWESVGGIMECGGTIIGTARCKEFRERSGRLLAVTNMIKHGIDHLIIIGGDGSLTGANILKNEWSSLLAELVESGKITAESAARHAELRIIGMVGSIDNDMADTDMTIGADSALHRITEAIDALSSTASSHQRVFVVEVMGRNCGYLAMMSAIATGAECTFIPEAPPEPGWEDKLCEILRQGRQAGRRDCILIVAEGARDSQGTPISSNYVKEVVEQGLKMEARVTILGHVQRGGAPAVYDRCMSTISGWVAVNEILKPSANSESTLVAVRGNRIITVPLMAAVEKTQAIAAAIKAKNFELARELRGSSWNQMVRIFRTLALSSPREPQTTGKRIAVVTCGWPAPGMNNAIRTAVKIGIDHGHTVLGVHDGFNGLIEGKIRRFSWMEVDEWNACGGSKLGTNRKVPEERELSCIARTLAAEKIDALLMIGGWSGYQTIYQLSAARKQFPEFNLPMVCVPAGINNNLPGAELAIGADTALNIIVEALDKIKHSSDTTHRAFVVEVMGRYCGYLAMMSGLASGAEYIYLHEHGVNLEQLQQQICELKNDFQHGGRNVALLIRNEKSNPTYTTEFICDLFQEAGEGVFDTRKVILGSMQQGGTPSPFDRIQAVRLAFEGLGLLEAQLSSEGIAAQFLGHSGGELRSYDISALPAMSAMAAQRPVKQWWEPYYDIAMALAKKP